MKNQYKGLFLVILCLFSSIFASSLQVRTSSSRAYNIPLVFDNRSGTLFYARLAPYFECTDSRATHMEKIVIPDKQNTVVQWRRITETRNRASRAQCEHAAAITYDLYTDKNYTQYAGSISFYNTDVAVQYIADSKDFNFESNDQPDLIQTVVITRKEF